MPCLDADEDALPDGDLLRAASLLGHFARRLPEIDPNPHSPTYADLEPLLAIPRLMANLDAAVHAAVTRMPDRTAV